MLKAVRGNWFIDRLCKIFELDASVICHIDLSLEAQEAVTITVTSIVSEEDAEEVITLLKKYVLIEAENDN
jgi:hypothetical protein